MTGAKLLPANCRRTGSAAATAGVHEDHWSGFAFFPHLGHVGAKTVFAVQLALSLDQLA